MPELLINLSNVKNVILSRKLKLIFLKPLLKENIYIYLELIKQ